MVQEQSKRKVNYILYYCALYEIQVFIGEKTGSGLIFDYS